MALLAILAPFAGSSEASRTKVLIGATASAATLLLTLPFLRWQHMRAADAGLVPERLSAVRFVLGAVLGTLLATVHVVLMAGFAHVQLVRAPSPDVNEIAATCLGFLLLATREEIVFRGYALRALEAAFGAWPALLMMAVPFALEHALAGASWPDALMGAGVGALVFGMAALASRGLALPIGLHAAWNCVDWATGGKTGDGLLRRVVDPAHLHESTILGMASFVFVMAIALCLLAYARHAGGMRKQVPRR